METRTDERRRGLWFSAWLVFLFLISIWYAWSGVGLLAYQAPGFVYTTERVLAAVVSPVGVGTTLDMFAAGAVVAMWFWSRSGYYIYLLSVSLMLITKIGYFGYADRFDLGRLIILVVTWRMVQSRRHDYRLIEWGVPNRG